MNRPRSLVQARSDFARQLHGALLSRGLTSTAQKRDWLARKGAVSQETARLWLNGESQPRLETVQRLIDQGLALSPGETRAPDPTHWSAGSSELRELDDAIARASAAGHLSSTLVARLIAQLTAGAAAE